MILDGKKVAEKIRLQIKNEVDSLVSHGQKKPSLAVVLVGENPASQIYVRNKQKAAQTVGIDSSVHLLPEFSTQEQVLKKVFELNKDPQIDAILVQLPLPSHINTQIVIQSINPQKDADGLIINSPVVACTPLGILMILDDYQIPIAGKHVVIVGRSSIVGKPMAQLLLDHDATVTICHSKTKDLKSITKLGDIVIVAAGKKHLLGQGAFKKDAIVIDVGIHRLDQHQLCGDVDFHAVINEVQAITPVPGGVGPMTITALLKNTIELAKNRNGIG